MSQRCSKHVSLTPPMCLGSSPGSAWTPAGTSALAHVAVGSTEPRFGPDKSHPTGRPPRLGGLLAPNWASGVSGPSWTDVLPHNLPLETSSVSKFPEGPRLGTRASPPPPVRGMVTLGQTDEMSGPMPPSEQSPIQCTCRGDPPPGLLGSAAQPSPGACGSTLGNCWAGALLGTLVLSQA